MAITEGNRTPQVASQPSATERFGTGGPLAGSCGVGGHIHQFCASPALPADRPYLASVMHWQRQPDSLAMTAAVMSQLAFPVGPAPGVASRTAGQPTRQRDSLQASLSAPGRRDSHSA